MEDYKFLNKTDRIKARMAHQSRIYNPLIINHDKLSDIRNRNQTIQLINNRAKGKFNKDITDDFIIG